MPAILPTVAELHPLRDYVEDEFSGDALEAAARALADRENPLRLNFFCAAIRILFEHSMDRLAPSEEVRRCSWFEQDPTYDGVTRPQRVKFAVQGGLSDAFVADQLGLGIDALQRDLKRTTQDLGKHIHARETTVVRDPAKQDVEAAAIINSAVAFFDAAGAARAAVVTPVAEALDAAAVEALLFETILDIDELASHHSIDEIYVDSTRVHLLDAEWIVYRAEGTVAAELQWGSNSDLRRGDGATLKESFPFTCDFRVPVESPWNLEDAETEFGVDTSAWTYAMRPTPIEETWD